MNQIITAYMNIPEQSRSQAAQELHEKVLYDVQQVQAALVTFCVSLKTMRDTKLFLELGCETFDDYVEERIGIRRRQAYNYIQTYERLGTEFLQSNAQMGITKLQLLTEISAVDRTDFVENNDLSGMTVQQIKELVEQNTSRGEQLSLLEEQLKEYESRPIEIAVQEPTKEQIDSIKKELEKEYKKKTSAAVKEAKEKAVADAEKLKTAAVEEAKVIAAKETAAELQAALEKADTEKAAALQKASEIAAKLEKSADADLVTANHQFMTAIEFFDKFIETVKKIDSNDKEKADKLRAAARTAIEELKGELS